MIEDPAFGPHTTEAPQIKLEEEEALPPRLSQVFQSLADNANGPVTVRQIRDALGDRSFATLLIFFAAINLLPLPPGTTLVLGMPLMIVSAQMVWGRKIAWLPEFILVRSVQAEQFRALAERFIPRLVWLERWIKPRVWPLPDRYDERVIGLLALVMGTLVTLPIPLGNWFPALTIALAALALSERDGVLLGVACAAGAFSVVLIVALAGTVTYALQAVSAWFW
ncbi:exopolysaccharide biosynthesis protein [Tianweitania sp. BSSL-BM11]|uniref:Exopolysaccharide biosynthesis protein n=1 Tax=Tianweitania aestuarii TaxID=2814886 RepID=A0ABS5RUT7_9HYPH|nr:exopolysaccharide biosynthesis protein [Tianweitania aestuarii]MBS9720816.1 exopolysaccharide biosynthesis protein [Tianweitania aestuarii]